MNIELLNMTSRQQLYQVNIKQGELQGDFYNNLLLEGHPIFVEILSLLVTKMLELEE